MLRMHGIQRKTAILLAGVCFVVLTGCGVATKPAAQKPTVVTLWSWSPLSSTMTQMVKAIEKRHPNIEIKASIEPHTAYFTALKAGKASGTLPDLIGLSPGAVTQEYRTSLQPLNKVASQFWGSNWKSNFGPAIIQQARLGNPSGDNNYYMLPEESEVINIWYNRTIFDKLHLTPPKTLPEMISDAHALSAAGYIPFYQGAATGLFDTWVYMQLAAQTDRSGLMAADVGQTTWTQPGMVKAAEVWQTLFTQHVFQAGALGDLQYPTGANLFAAGRVGMMSLGSWWLQETKLPGPLPKGIDNMSGFGKFFFPAVISGGKPTPPLGGIDVGWGLTKNAASSPAVEKASETVLKDLISGPGEQMALNTFNDLPAFLSMKPTVSMTPHMKGLFDAYMAELPHAYNHQIGNPVIETALDSNLQALGAAKETPQQAMANVQKVALKQRK